MMVNELEVMISGNKAGVLRQGTDGSLSFQYLRDYRGVPLSSAIPLSLTFCFRILACEMNVNKGMYPRKSYILQNVYKSYL